MAYMSTEHAARIRADLKAAFPAADGWKLSVAKSSGSLGIDVTILAGPVDFMAYDYDPYAHDGDTPRSASHAQAMGRVKAQTEGGINHYHFRDHYTPETVAVLEKLIGIVLKEHWDKSDIQSDYFNCAFYPHFAIGTWRNPYVKTAPKGKGKARELEAA